MEQRPEWKRYVLQRYRHDCEECKFLGPYQAYDLWYCPKNQLGDAGTVIARYGSGGGEYESGLHIARFLRVRLDLEAPLAVALARAEKLGYLERPPGVSIDPVSHEMNIDLGVIALEAGITIPPDSFVRRNTIESDKQYKMKIELSNEIQARLSEYVGLQVSNEVQFNIRQDIANILKRKLAEGLARTFVDPAS